MFGVWLLVVAVLAAADVQGAPGSRDRRSDDDPGLLTEGAPGSRDRRSGDDPALLAVVNGHSQMLAQHGAQVTALQNTVAQLQQQLQQQHGWLSTHCLDTKIIIMDFFLYSAILHKK